MCGIDWYAVRKDHELELQWSKYGGEDPEELCE